MSSIQPDETNGHVIEWSSGHDPKYGNPVDPYPYCINCKKGFFYSGENCYHSRKCNCHDYSGQCPNAV